MELIRLPIYCQFGKRFVRHSAAFFAPFNATFRALRNSPRTRSKPRTQLKNNADCPVYTAPQIRYRSLSMSVFATVLLVSAVIIATDLVMIYNNLVEVKHNVAKAWANIDVLLKQRHDELPKRVETCKQSMKFEQDTLQKPHDGRLYLLSNYLPDRLQKKYTRWAWAHAVFCVGACAATATLFSRVPV